MNNKQNKCTGTGICYGSVCSAEHKRKIKPEFMSDDDENPFLCCSTDDECRYRDGSSPKYSPSVVCSFTDMADCLPYGSGCRDDWFPGIPDCGEHLYCATEDRLPGKWSCEANSDVVVEGFVAPVCRQVGIDPFGAPICDGMCPPNTYCQMVGFPPVCGCEP